MLQTTLPRMCFVVFAILTGGSWTSWYVASAPPPIELQGEYMMSKIRMHFCMDEWNTCMPSGDVRYICCGIISQQCFLDSEHPMCMEDDQVYVCGYRDAIVCRYEDGRGSCIYSTSSTRSVRPLCVCKENGMWPVSDAQASQIRGSCKGKETTTGLSSSYPGPPTATSSMSDQTTATSSMSDQTTETSSMSDQTTETKAPLKSGSGEVNIIAIVLGSTLVIVLLVFLVVCLVKRRRNQTLPKKATTNPTDSSVVNSAAPDSGLPVSVSLVPSGGEHEYAEVTPMDHKPAQHGHATDHTYANVKSNQQQRRGLSRFAKHNQGSPGMPNLPTGSDRIAPKLPTKDSVQDYEIPDVKTTTKATGVAAIGAVNEVSSEGLPDEEETINHTYFERK